MADIEIIVRRRPGQISTREITHTTKTHIAEAGASTPKPLNIGYHHFVQLPQSSFNRRHRKKR